MKRTVKELKDVVRKHNEEQCIPYSKLRKKELVGLVNQIEDKKPVRKPRAKAAKKPSMTKEEMAKGMAENKKRQDARRKGVEARAIEAAKKEKGDLGVYAEPKIDESKFAEMAARKNPISKGTVQKVQKAKSRRITPTMIARGGKTKAAVKAQGTQCGKKGKCKK